VPDPTLSIYDAQAERWTDTRQPSESGRARALAGAVGRGRVLDLGCGPGWHLPLLGSRAVGVDGAPAMLALAGRHAPGHSVVRADVRSLPFRARSFDGLWASRSLVHLRQAEVPLALAEAHRVLAVEAEAVLVLFRGDEPDLIAGDDNDFPGRHFSFWTPEHLERVVVGAGFELVNLIEGTGNRMVVNLRRLHSLPDTVGPDMRLLVVGLNPSPHAADSGVGFSRPGNRFWPAALDAGLISVDRDPRRALTLHGVGMTDLVKRTTRKADELRAAEYVAGLERLDHLCAWLAPDALCLVGLAGWRAAFDRKARPGWQDHRVGGRPVYVMPSTSGLNASSTRAALADHLAAAFAGPATPGAESRP
jgi:TDG/mug DNA glycosylase family protein